ncbi:hypothetical protein AGMMS49959_15250 [Planctomycetales bacterium]|nr:hypothetical protein AGMMS49959_15250 [Planctomycetales bacterium]
MILKNKELCEKIFSLLGVSKALEVADLFNVSNSLVCKWRNGYAHPSLETLNLVIEKSGVSWDELLTGKVPDLQNMKKNEIYDDNLKIVLESWNELSKEERHKIAGEVLEFLRQKKENPVGGFQTMSATA